MRFSLATLMLVVLFAASLASLWLRREVWYLHRTTFADAPSIKRLRAISPDGTRILTETQFQRGMKPSVSMLDKDPKSGVLKTLEVGHWMYAEFRDDDTIDVFSLQGVDLLKMRKMDEDMTKLQLRTYHRRYPEWWWGQFYRPEVWLALACGLTLIVGTWRSRRKRSPDTVHTGQI